MHENNNDYCGVVRTYYDNAKKYLGEEYFINAGKKEGIYKVFHSNGKLYKEVNYIDGLMNGICKSYHSNGKLEKEVNYIDGKKS